MIGVFDSGVGGITAFCELRGLLPRDDMIYLADRRNAPYGTKSESELVLLVREDIRRLCELGCEKILIACCTASTVVKLLSDSERRICTPIILPTARAALSPKTAQAVTPSKSGRRSDAISEASPHIAVIATEHTVGTHAFRKALKSEWFKAEKSYYPTPRVTEIATQSLVYEVEGGSRDGKISESCAKILEEIAERISDIGASTLILGCTHFSHLEGELRKRLPSVRVISAAREGARALYISLLKENHRPQERGRTVYV